MGAGLLLSSFVNLQRVHPGFDPEGVVAVTVSLPQSRYPEVQDLQRFWLRAEQLVSGAPGVLAAGITSDLPPDNGGNVDNFNLVDHPVPAGESEPVTPWGYVTPGYFQALGIPLLDGRLFTPSDSGTGTPVVVVSRSWATRFFPGENPIGRLLVQGGCYDCPRTVIIGVVGDVKYSGLTGTGEGAYGPVSQMRPRRMTIVVKSRASAAAALRDIRQDLRGLDAELAPVETTLHDNLRDTLSDPRRWSAMLTGFAGVAMGLAAFGVFGLMSYMVRQRRREIGLRLALGAQPGAVTRLVVRKGLGYAAIGLALGLGLAFLEARWLRNLLFQVTPGDPVVLAGAGLVLAGAALIASWLPGRRAARIPAVEAIQSE
jgi:predicted permease